MLARRMTIMVLLVTLFAMGFSAVVAETSRERVVRQGVFASCGLAPGIDCFDDRTQRR